MVCDSAQLFAYMAYDGQYPEHMSHDNFGPAPGVWGKIEADESSSHWGWQHSMYGSQGLNMWNMPQQLKMPEGTLQQRKMAEVMPYQQNQLRTSAGSKAKKVSDASMQNSKVPQTPARAAKRQRGRERRKMAKTEAKAAYTPDSMLPSTNCSDTHTDKGSDSGTESIDDDSRFHTPMTQNRCIAVSPQSDRSELTLSFDARVARDEIKLVVRKTFIEAEVDDIGVDSIEINEHDVILPEALFNTSEDFNEWRQAYRKFRLGYHLGARGEATQQCGDIQ